MECSNYSCYSSHSPSSPSVAMVNCFGLTLPIIGILVSLSPKSKIPKISVATISYLIMIFLYQIYRNFLKS